MKLTDRVSLLAKAIGSDIKELQTTLMQIFDSMQFGAKNLIIVRDVIEGKRIDHNTGDLIDAAEYATTGFIPVVPNGRLNNYGLGYYSFSNWKKPLTNIRVAFYDNQKKFSSGKEYTYDFFPFNQVSIPSAVYFVRISARIGELGSDYHDWQFERGDRATDWRPSPEDAAYNANSYADNAVSGLKVGGRNLIIGSNIDESFKLQGWFKRRTVIQAGQLDPFGGNMAIKATASSGADSSIYLGYNDDTYKGTALSLLANEAGEYTFSVYLRSDENRDFPIRLTTDNYVITAKLTTEWQRFSITATRDTTSTKIELGGYGSWNSTDSMPSVYLSHMKYEKGSKATDWTPAPETLYSSVSDNVINSLPAEGRNLFRIKDSVAGYESNGNIVSGPAMNQTMQTLVPISGNLNIICQLWNDDLITSAYTNRVAFFAEDKTFISSIRSPKLNGTPYELVVMTPPSGAKWIRIGTMADANGIFGRVRAKVEEGFKPTRWSLAPEDIQKRFEDVEGRLSIAGSPSIAFKELTTTYTSNKAVSINHGLGTGSGIYSVDAVIDRNNGTYFTLPGCTWDNTKVTLPTTTLETITSKPAKVLITYKS